MGSNTPQLAVADTDRDVYHLMATGTRRQLLSAVPSRANDVSLERALVNWGVVTRQHFSQMGPALSTPATSEHYRAPNQTNDALADAPPDEIWAKQVQDALDSMRQHRNDWRQVLINHYRDGLGYPNRVLDWARYWFGLHW